MKAKDTKTNRVAFAVERGYSSAHCVNPRETYIWKVYQAWLHHGPETLAKQAAWDAMTEDERELARRRYVSRRSDC